jgi:hypothetical protein
MFAKPGANPTLESIEYVRKALETADGPVSRNQLLETLAGWGHSTTRQSLNAALAFLDDLGTTAEGDKGIIWVPEASPQLREIIRKGRSL